MTREQIDEILGYPLQVSWYDPERHVCRSRRSPVPTTLRRRNLTTHHVVLREIEDADGSRHLEASLTPNGDVIIQGRDYGDGVERIFGVREYEWAWTIRAACVPALLRALEATDDVLSAISAQFSGANAGGLSSFLAANGIATERWARHGD